MKKILFWFLKAGIAVAIAFVLMSLFCYFYYNLPVHHKETSGATDYNWDKNTFCSRGTEGFAYQFTDENGYVNTYPKKSDQIDVLVMGSSHTEGFNVNYDENYTYVLNDLFQKGGQDLYAYSIATSSHALVRNLRNLENALDQFQPTKYVVIETASLDIPTEDVEKLVNGKLEFLDSSNSGLLGTLQKSDVLRLMYYQMSQMSINKTRSDKPLRDDAAFEIALDQALERAGSAARAKNCQLILTYLSLVEYDYNGILSDATDPKSKELFQKLCDKHGIIFLDMYPAYEEMYRTTNHLPRGFSNTTPGEGHTNKYGHACIAQTLYEYIAKGDLK